MATKKVDFIVSEKGSAKTKAGLKSVDKQLMSMAKSAIGLGAVLVAVRKAAELTKLAADAVNVEKAFRNLAKEPDKMLQAMKKAVGGTIQEFELMKQFNQAALLGLPLDRFDEMLAIARSSAQATGQSMDFMLNSIVTGIGRQSRLMIDNLGLIVSIGDANKKYAAELGVLSSELTQLQQKTAFANAVLEAGAANIEKMGGEAKGAFDNVKALTSMIKDSTIDAFKNLVKPVDDVSKALVDFMNIASLGAMTPEERFLKLSKSADFFRIELDRLADSLQKRADAEKLAREAEEFRLLTEGEAALLAEEGTTANRDYRTSLDEIVLSLNDLDGPMNNLLTDSQKITLAIDDMTRSMVEAIITGQDLGDALQSILRGIAVRGLSALLTGGIASIVGGAAFDVGGILSNTFIPKAASGADFITSGPQLMMVGEAGREQVSVTPLEGPNINGPQGGVTVNLYGDIIGTDEYMENNLIPAINLAVQQGRAALA